MKIHLIGSTLLRRVRNWNRRAIPIFFHGDGVPTTGVGKAWGKSLNVFDWGSLLALGVTREIVFWIWAVFAEVASPRAMKLFWKILKWSFNALWSGKHPFADFHGHPYPAGSPEALRAGTPLVGTDNLDHYFCVIWRFKADGDFCHKDQHNYTRLNFIKRGLCCACLHKHIVNFCMQCISFVNTHPTSMKAHKDLHLNGSHSCNQCPADIHNFPYTDVSENPCWKGRNFTPAEFKTRFPDRAEILDVDGTGHLAIGMDSMHNKHLGADQYYAASVLYLLVFVVMPGQLGCHPTSNSTYKGACSSTLVFSILLTCIYVFSILLGYI